LIWGVTAFWALMFLIACILWRENKKAKLRNYLTDQTILFGILPVLIALAYHFWLGLENYFLLFVCGFYGLITGIMYFQERE
jgi:hypothetical protein